MGYLARIQNVLSEGAQLKSDDVFFLFCFKADDKSGPSFA